MMARRRWLPARSWRGGVVVVVVVVVVVEVEGGGAGLATSASPLSRL
jgi:hypothetical protein